MDEKGADILLLHNAGEFIAWPENVEAFAIILHAAGVAWTLSTETAGYDSINYGFWYDDFQFARVAVTPMPTSAGIARRSEDLPRGMRPCPQGRDRGRRPLSSRAISSSPGRAALPLLEEIVMSGQIKLDPSRNNFPVTLHDPCNMVRPMGIVEPQRQDPEKDLPRSFGR